MAAMGREPRSTRCPHSSPTGSCCSSEDRKKHEQAAGHSQRRGAGVMALRCGAFTRRLRVVLDFPRKGGRKRYVVIVRRSTRRAGLSAT